MKKCRVCGSTKISPLFTLADYPLISGPVTRTPRAVATCDLEVALCHRCGTCSLTNDVDDLAYGDDYTSSNIVYGNVKSMDERTDRFIDFIGQSGKPAGSRALEIGCYDGTFMGLLRDRLGFNMFGHEYSTTIADEARGRGYNVLSGPFSPSDYSDIDVVIARNVLEHVPQPNQFVKDVASVLKRDGLLVLEIPNGAHFIRIGVLGTIVPEHPCYYSKDSLKRLLGNHFTFATVTETGSTLCALASHPRSRPCGEDEPVDIADLTAGGWTRQMRCDAVRELVGNKEIDLFGANTCTLELLAARVIDADQVNKVYDDDPRRWGRYLVNTKHIVLPRSSLNGNKPCNVLVCSYAHRKPIADYVEQRGRNAITLYENIE